MIAKKLILVNHEEISFKDKTTGAEVRKHKYIFMKPDGSYMPPQYDENGFYQNDVQDQVVGWDEAKSSIFPFELKEFNGVITEKLATGRKNLSDNPKKK